jgi:hypothetical protein
VALDYQLARDIEMVDIGPQWIYDFKKTIESEESHK